MKLKCFCGKVYAAKPADIKRGWSKTCSKSCAAKKRELGKPNAVCAETGEKIKYGAKPDYSARNQRNAIARKEKIAKREGYYPFTSENEMYASMCDNPIEGR